MKRAIACLFVLSILSVPFAVGQESEMSFHGAATLVQLDGPQIYGAASVTRHEPGFLHPYVSHWVIRFTPMNASIDWVRELTRYSVIGIRPSMSVQAYLSMDGKISLMVISDSGRIELSLTIIAADGETRQWYKALRPWTPLTCQADSYSVNRVNDQEVEIVIGS